MIIERKSLDASLASLNERERARKKNGRQAICVRRLLMEKDFANVPLIKPALVMKVDQHALLCEAIWANPSTIPYLLSKTDENILIKHFYAF